MAKLAGQVLMNKEQLQQILGGLTPICFARIIWPNWLIKVGIIRHLTGN
jgi:hypothetical protein